MAQAVHSRSKPCTGCGANAGEKEHHTGTRSCFVHADRVDQETARCADGGARAKSNQETVADGVLHDNTLDLLGTQGSHSIGRFDRQ